jgi:DNA polymerase III gamma/tau subunit
LEKNANVPSFISEVPKPDLWEMVGQEVVATTLKQAIEQGKISHAYLFSGPRGTGKTSVRKFLPRP